MDANKIANFLNNESTEGEVCDAQTGICYIKTKDGLIEKTLIEKKLVLEDGRELLREDRYVSHSDKNYLR